VHPKYTLGALDMKEEEEHTYNVIPIQKKTVSPKTYFKAKYVLGASGT